MTPPQQHGRWSTASTQFVRPPQAISSSITSLSRVAKQTLRFTNKTHVPSRPTSKHSKVLKAPCSAKTSSPFDKIRSSHSADSHSRKPSNVAAYRGKRRKTPSEGEPKSERK